MTSHDSKITYAIGDRVVKVGGRYGGPGRIVGMTEDLDENGYRLFNVAMKVAGGYGEFIHVFPAATLRPDPAKAAATVTIPVAMAQLIVSALDEATFADQSRRVSAGVGKRCLENEILHAERAKP